MIRLSLAALVLCFATGAARAAEPLDAAAAWVGQDPYAVIGEGTLFELPEVRSGLARLGLEPGKDPMRRPFAVRQQGELLIVSLCDPTSCADRNLALLIDLTRDELGLCRYEARNSDKAMSFKLVLSRAANGLSWTLEGALSQALPNGCIEADAATLADLWDAFQRFGA